MGIGLYIHLPFCFKKCNYCDFISFSLKTEERDFYLKHLFKEMELYQERLPKEDLVLETLYLGGGTPTSLTTYQLEKLLMAIKNYFYWPPGIEATIEANPGTIDLDKLNLLKNFGINRLSIGAQSFLESELKEMGRTHGVEEIYRGVSSARKADFQNISLDLIYGLPNQGLDHWRYNLQKALELDLEHLSSYGLKIEENTPWGILEDEGKLILPVADEQRLMYDEICIQAPRHGYNHYEISNFAKGGYEGKHNSRYWLLKPYLGLGVGAASFLAGERWTNYSNLENYFSAVKENRLPHEIKAEKNKEAEMAEMFFLGLRLLAGVDLLEFEARFAVSPLQIFSKEIERQLKLGLVIIKDNKLKLTPEAIPIANEVFQAFI